MAMGLVSIHVSAWLEFDTSLFTRTIQRVSQIGASIHVSPVEVVRKIILIDVSEG